MCKKDSRIHYYGVVSAEKANEILQQADVLVNPRQNDDEYTKYSFPSKNIEYLMTGNAVVAYMLDGIPEEYASFFNVPKSNQTESLAEAMKEAMNEKTVEKAKKNKMIRDYIECHCGASSVAKQIVDVIGER